MVTSITMRFDTFSTSVWFQCRLPNTVLSVVHHLFHGCKQGCGFNVGQTLVMSVNWPPSNKVGSNICSTGITYCLMSFKIDQNTTQKRNIHFHTVGVNRKPPFPLLCRYHSLPPKTLALDSKSRCHSHLFIIAVPCTMHLFISALSPHQIGNLWVLLSWHLHWCVQA